MARPIYDEIGRTYLATRRADPRFEALIWDALGDAETVLNVGAGAGAYEPPGRVVTAVEPSRVMIAQRPPGGAPVVEASAESLPFPDGSFEAAMAVFSDHHWSDRQRGLRELRRIARRRVVLFNMDPGAAVLFWLTTEYLPAFLDLIDARYRIPGAWEAELRIALGGQLTLVPAPIPHDCTDGFYGAYWRRPEAYVDPVVRDGISVFSKLRPDDVARGIAALCRDLDSGAWHERHADLLRRDELELGYYVVVAEFGASGIPARLSRSRQ